jgi:hypothetical protein
MAFVLTMATRVIILMMSILTAQRGYSKYNIALIIVMMKLND